MSHSPLKTPCKAFHLSCPHCVCNCRSDLHKNAICPRLSSPRSSGGNWRKRFFRLQHKVQGTERVMSGVHVGNKSGGVIGGHAAFCDCEVGSSVCVCVFSTCESISSWNFPSHPLTASHKQDNPVTCSQTFFVLCNNKVYPLWKNMLSWVGTMIFGKESWDPRARTHKQLYKDTYPGPFAHLYFYLHATYRPESGFYKLERTWEKIYFTQTQTYRVL